MKDSEFIELLNLYLDHEITAADAARLEAEVQTNPVRRQTYAEYCRMQKACKILARDFQAASVPAPDGKVVAFESAPSRRRIGPFYAASALVTAAACVAIVFVVRTQEPAGGAAAPRPAMAVSSSAESATTAVPATPLRVGDRYIGRTVTVPAGRDGPQPTLVSALTLVSDGGAPASALFTRSEQPAPQFEWMRAVQFAPVQRVATEEFRFDSRSTNVGPDDRTFNHRPALPNGAVEWNAIRYQK